MNVDVDVDVDVGRPFGRRKRERQAGPPSDWMMKSLDRSGRTGSRPGRSAGGRAGWLWATARVYASSRLKHFMKENSRRR